MCLLITTWNYHIVIKKKNSLRVSHKSFCRQSENNKNRHEMWWDWNVLSKQSFSEPTVSRLNWIITRLYQPFICYIVNVWISSLVELNLSHSANFSLADRWHSMPVETAKDNCSHVLHSLLILIIQAWGQMKSTLRHFHGEVLPPQVFNHSLTKVEKKKKTLFICGEKWCFNWSGGV